jgi:hypothetical protein
VEHLLTQKSRSTTFVSILLTSEPFGVRNLPILQDLAVKMGSQRSQSDAKCDRCEPNFTARSRSIGRFLTPQGSEVSSILTKVVDLDF